jgi:serine/threonine protein kinase
LASDSGTVEPVDSDPVAIGDLIDGRYRIESLIARGGQASVWKASQEPLQRNVALKVLTAPPTREGSEPFRERFLLEAKTLASLNHPNIVIVYDYGRVSSGCYYIAMEHVEGVRFSRILRERPIDAARRIRLVSQACSALRYAHQRGVIHRDVKNANILVRQDSAGEEEVKVVDFGIVKLMESDPGITQEGVILGSPHFMSPEQITGAFFDHRADIYAVGVLLYCSVTGRYPYRGKDARSIMTNHLKKPIPVLKSRDPRLVGDEEFENIVRSCLAKRPDDRFDDMDALIAALAPYASGERFEIIDLGAEALEDLSEEVDEVEDLITGRTERAEMALHPFHDDGVSMTSEMGAMLLDEEEAPEPEPEPEPERLPTIGVIDIEQIAGLQEVDRTNYDPEDNLTFEPAVAHIDAPDFTAPFDEDEVGFNTDAITSIPEGSKPPDEAEDDVGEDDEAEGVAEEDAGANEDADAEEDAHEPAEESAEESAENEDDVDEERIEDEPVADEAVEEDGAVDEAVADEAVADEAVADETGEDEAPVAEADAADSTPEADAAAPEEAPPKTPPVSKAPVVIPELDEPVSDSRLFKLWIAAFGGTLLLAGIAGRLMGLF